MGASANPGQPDLPTLTGETAVAGFCGKAEHSRSQADPEPGTRKKGEGTPMKRITKAAWHGLLAGGGALAAVGCTEGERCYDPCYPERYTYVSRQEVLHAMAPKVQNGHILDQTMWNYFFDEGSDRLTEGGRDHL